MTSRYGLLFQDVSAGTSGFDKSLQSRAARPRHSLRRQRHYFLRLKFLCNASIGNTSSAFRLVAFGILVQIVKIQISCTTELIEPHSFFTYDQHMQSQIGTPCLGVESLVGRPALMSSLIFETVPRAKHENYSQPPECSCSLLYHVFSHLYFSTVSYWKFIFIFILVQYLTFIEVFNIWFYFCRYINSFLS